LAENTHEQARGTIKLGLCCVIALFGTLEGEIRQYCCIILFYCLTAFEYTNFHRQLRRIRVVNPSPSWSPKTCANLLFDRVSAAAPTFLQTAVRAPSSSILSGALPAKTGHKCPRHPSSLSRQTSNNPPTQVPRLLWTPRSVNPLPVPSHGTRLSTILYRCSSSSDSTYERPKLSHSERGRGLEPSSTSSCGNARTRNEEHEDERTHWFQAASRA
jgi:hypothetical protein